MNIFDYDKIFSVDLKTLTNKQIEDRIELLTKVVIEYKQLVVDINNELERRRNERRP